MKPQSESVQEQFGFLLKRTDVILFTTQDLGFKFFRPFMSQITTVYFVQFIQFSFFWWNLV